jgi:hypothetical protein
MSSLGLEGFGEPPLQHFSQMKKNNPERKIEQNTNPLYVIPCWCDVVSEEFSLLLAYTQTHRHNPI